jgi:predicted DNA-binding protein
MYTPKIKEKLIRRLYRIKQEEKRPMTKIVNEIIETYLNERKSNDNTNENIIGDTQRASENNGKEEVIWKIS